MMAMMAMIKVGQIYLSKKKNIPMVVTSVSFKKVYVYRGVHGVYGYARVNFERYNFKLIAEYPTWQEAVNSEYFKNDD